MRSRWGGGTAAPRCLLPRDRGPGPSDGHRKDAETTMGPGSLSTGSNLAQSTVAGRGPSWPADRLVTVAAYETRR
ncbi:hypothetical protein FRAAL3567 [Frankia alni ACN14a]|uniref:Uncharacterized protein n=1 Tax=Frankia alni (strain DSM 45986 / CECT 9034 / ACN14a) TaxID=326424 RepID=Q0RJV0_FRAAA|nr:hypothetical protein FRAAL3567 [Frankia alni ACN14a]